MPRPLVLIAAFAALAFAGLTFAQNEADELKKIHGDWKITKVESIDKNLEKLLENAKISFEEKKVTVTFTNDEKGEMTFKIDPTKKPKQIDFTDNEAKERKGIYELKGDVLKLAMADVGNERPTELAFKDGVTSGYVEMKKQKMTRKAPAILVAFFIVAALLIVGFSVLTGFVLGGTRLPDLDRAIAESLRRPPEEGGWLRQVMIGFTHAGGVVFLSIIAIGGAAWEYTRGRRFLAGAWLAIVIGGALLNVALKTSFDRVRPPAEWRDPFVSENNESFPSGHSMASMIGYGMLAYALLPLVRQRRLKLLIIILWAVIVALIGLSRIYLRAHWFTDVAAGFAIGLAWLGLSLGVVEMINPRLVAERPPTV